jgi:hypothetical protein
MVSKELGPFTAPSTAIVDTWLARVEPSLMHALRLCMELTTTLGYLVGAPWFETVAKTKRAN